jgi:hypothetical protein
MEMYEEGLVIGRRLATADASNAEAQHELSVTLDRIAGVFRARDDLAGALKAVEEGLAIVARRLAVRSRYPQ